MVASPRRKRRRMRRRCCRSRARDPAAARQAGRRCLALRAPKAATPRRPRLRGEGEARREVRWWRGGGERHAASPAETRLGDAAGGGAGKGDEPPPALDPIAGEEAGREGGGGGGKPATDEPPRFAANGGGDGKLGFEVEGLEVGGVGKEAAGAALLTDAADACRVRYMDAGWDGGRGGKKAILPAAGASGCHRRRRRRRDRLAVGLLKERLLLAVLALHLVRPVLLRLPGEEASSGFAAVRSCVRDRGQMAMHALACFSRSSRMPLSRS